MNLHKENEEPGQTEQMLKLIWIFAVRISRDIIFHKTPLIFFHLHNYDKEDGWIKLILHYFTINP